jgi:hypothetical protein
MSEVQEMVTHLVSSAMLVPVILGLVTLLFVRMCAK